ncbi:low molecular weight protein tyrosine phosphatase family protein [Dyadobacter frigoris]|uniref:Protein tyrosine phosphatase n=1 Tax=Dyadobacter frigoris TaxID=2576211 RepID=A0A4U6CWI5_9BACT|nr:protein tyrosine phosphatase [Dyadobacter frigoris]TKT88676.1 protein tyrosine phosphatase [Dyadobacter frigoris]GLU53861.1 phosphotyrosine protein phosphatase [Dyadobacter frigoris]
MNILFVCSKNQWRSPTAEEIYKNHESIHVRSAGTEPGARIKITARLISWADIIFVMEKKHKQRLIQRCPDEMSQSKVVILDIEDHYKFMDPELVDMIRSSVDPYLGGG